MATTTGAAPLFSPGIHAAETPSRPAVVMGESGRTVTFAELEARSCRLARLFRAEGLRAGDTIAILMDNNADYLPVAWAAQRSGLYFTPVNWHLKLEEAGYVIKDSGARLLIASAALSHLALELVASLSQSVKCFMVGGAVRGYRDLEAALAPLAPQPLADETEGMVMFYSSGTTGYPKGIKRALSGNPFGTPGVLEGLLRMAYGFDATSVYLCPGPLYHAAPLAYSLAAQRLGATVVVMETFDPEQVLRLIARHRVTHAQFVPTHFVRMLHLADDVRGRYDLSSLKAAIHAAAPCPVEVKEAMIAWWGPVIFEYYAGSEGNGFCMVGTEDWLKHKGTVGRSMLGPVHIVGPDGAELPAGEEGLVYFEGGLPFEYHNAPDKTREAHHANGWSTLGD